MKDTFLRVFKSFIDWLSYIYDKYSKEKLDSSPYQPLSPTDEAKNIDHYFSSLDWALQHPKRIKNIAISGPFGSGKSSFIKTFQNRNANNIHFHFLPISLATFEDGKVSSNKPNDEILRLIELSILQQLFYFEEDKNIPDSRFKKIKNFKRRRLLILTILISLFFVALINLIFPDFLAKILLIPTIAPQTKEQIHYVSLLISILGILYIVFRSIRILEGLVISKLSIKDAEIEIDNQISKSILNQHIDEIIYFFEATHYNVVVIEDLDRFEQTEVFTKLREINLLINNSKKVKQNVTFIYAVKDDMFQGNDRTKFFDFVIPIIPVINSSNSIEQLSKIIRDNNYNISDELLDNISLFIDDMRLLNNIMNEYHLYSKSLDENLSQDKLLAMMVYKNILPDDFSKLNNNKGILYEVLSDKHRYIRGELDKTDDEITQIKSEINQLEATRLKDIGELRTLYLATLVNKIISSHPQSFSAFHINSQRIDLNQATEDDNFNYFLTSRSINYFNYQSNRSHSINIDFKSIEKEVDVNLTYKEREQIIIDKNDNKIDLLMREIEDAEEKKNRIKEQKIKDLFSNKKIDIKVDNGKHKDLLSVLLRFGYIAEDYFDYISIFYEGSLSKADYQFLINVRTQQITEPSYELLKIENLLKRINPTEFDHKFVLNYSLVEFLLSNNQHDEKKERLFSQLENQSDSSIQFIDGFINHTVNIELFMQILCGYWTNIWRFLENEADYSEEKIDRYFKLIIEYADVSDIENIFDGYEDRIAEDKDFLRLIDNTEKLKEIISVLNIKFADIASNSPEQLIEFIYHGNYYIINPNMLRVMLNHHKAFNQIEFDTQNYSLIKTASLPQLNNYIENNINEYISSIYLKLENNVNEPLQYLAELLNNNEISIENKEKIIIQTKTIIDDIDEIEDLQVVNLLSKESKILITWENTISIYIRNENELSDELISFFNIVDNTKKLSDRKIKFEDPNEEIKRALAKSLLLEERINSGSYINILNSIPYIYLSLDFSTLTYQKVELLVRHKKLATNGDNFKMLSEHFDKLRIALIENNPRKFIDDIGSFELENGDILEILKSAKIPTEIKEKLIDYFETTRFTDDSQLLNQVGKLLLRDKNFNFDDQIIIKSILTQSNLRPLEKIEIFNKKNGLFDNNDIDDFLSSINEPYSDISINGKRPSIPNNETNKSFVKILEENKYISSYKMPSFGLGPIKISTFTKKR